MGYGPNAAIQHQPIDKPPVPEVLEFDENFWQFFNNLTPEQLAALLSSPEDSGLELDFRFEDDLNAFDDITGPMPNQRLDEDDHSALTVTNDALLVSADTSRTIGQISSLTSQLDSSAAITTMTRHLSIPPRYTLAKSAVSVMPALSDADRPAAEQTAGYVALMDTSQASIVHGDRSAGLAPLTPDHCLAPRSPPSSSPSRESIYQPGVRQTGPASFVRTDHGSSSRTISVRALTDNHTSSHYLVLNDEDASEGQIEIVGGVDSIAAHEFSAPRSPLAAGDSRRIQSHIAHPTQTPASHGADPESNIPSFGQTASSNSNTSKRTALCISSRSVMVQGPSERSHRLALHSTQCRTRFRESCYWSIRGKASDIFCLRWRLQPAARSLGAQTDARTPV